MLQPNPKYPIDPNIREWMTLKSFTQKDIVPIGLEQDESGRLHVTVLARVRKLAYLIKSKNELALNDALTPTTAHWLSALIEKVPEWKTLHLSQMKGFRGSSPVTRMLGVTAGAWLKRLRTVSERGIENYYDAPGEQVEKTWTYKTSVPLARTSFYHATLAERVPSIRQQGLRPSGLGEGRTEGWSPGWNWNLQQAVYLFADPARALAVAETLALRNQKDAVVLRVWGNWIGDTRKLVADEDALRDEYDDSVNYGNLDRDFPPWVTSIESRHKSIAYQDTIAPKFISVWAKVKYSTETWVDGRTDEEMVEESTEIEGGPEVMRLLKQMEDE